VHKQHPAEWPVPTDPSRTNQIGDIQLVTMLAKLSEKYPVYYLHPSFGYYFEYFSQVPRGLCIEMKPYPTNSFLAASLNESQVEENEKFWSASKADLRQLVSFISSPASSTNVAFKQTLLHKFQIPYEPNPTAVVLGAFYSQALNSWGVELQRQGKLAEARENFKSALELNPDNIAARSNLDLNGDLQAGRQPVVRTPKSIEEELGRFSTWQAALSVSGPFDDPTHCLGLGIIFGRGRLYREAAQEFERVHELVPDHLLTRYWLARLYLQVRLPEKAAGLVSGFRGQTDALEKSGIPKPEILQTEASALFAVNKSEQAEGLLHDAMQADPANTNLLSVVVQISSMFRRYSTADSALDRLLQINPNDTGALVSKGMLSIDSRNFKDAIPPLTHALSLQSNNYSARLYRAIAYLNSDQLDEAQQDFQSLHDAFPKSNEANGGLGEIAWRRKDTNAAIQYYRACLTNTPPGSPQAKFIGDRLDGLQQRSP
jgi:tetratricopeptide (TPR) repeat protein